MRRTVPSAVTRSPLVCSTYENIAWARLLTCLSFTTLLTGCGGGDSSAGAGVVPTVSLSASPMSLATGAATTLTWSSTDASSCSASGSWSGSKATSGTETISVGAAIGSVSFTLSCNGRGGTTVQGVTVTVQAPAPAPDLTFRADPLTVVFGGNTTLTWSSTDATTCTASGLWSGSKPPSGTETLSLGAAIGKASFTLACSGSRSWDYIAERDCHDSRSGAALLRALQVHGPRRRGKPLRSDFGRGWQPVWHHLQRWPLLR